MSDLPSRYRVLDSLGKGGMGEVFFTDDTQLGRKVAIKFLSELLEADEKALRQAHALPHKIAQPEVRRWYAWMLIDRGEAGDTDKARTLLGEAVEMYQTIGMPKHEEITAEMLGRPKP